MELPVHEFCELVYGWLLEGRDQEARAEIERILTDPIPGMAKQAPTQDELDADYKAMMAFGASLS